MNAAAQILLFKPYQLKRLEAKNFRRRRCVGRVLHLGGGVQSTTLAYMAVEGELKIDLALFADTGDEPFWVYQTVGRVRSLLAARGIPLVMTMRCCGYRRWFIAGPDAPRASMPLWVKTPGKTRPGRLLRQCTQELKITPNERYLKAWLIARGLIQLPPGFSYHNGYLWNRQSRLEARDWPRLAVPRDVFIETLFGISSDESSRAKERGPRWQQTRYPLIELGMSRQDCVAWLEAHGYAVPFKSACIQCPYRSDEAWLWMQQRFPDEFEEACRYDDWLRTPAAKQSGPYSRIRGEMYIHRTCLPLREVNFAALMIGRSKATSEFELELLQTCSSDGGFSCMS